MAVGLGKLNDTLNTEENIDLNREAVRGAAAAGIRAVKQLGKILQDCSVFGLRKYQS